MNVEPEIIVGTAGLLLTIGGLITVSRKSDKENAEQWKAIHELRKAAAQHEKEAAERRLEIEKKFSELAVSLMQVNGKFETIVTKLSTIALDIQDMKECRHGKGAVASEQA